MKPQQALFHLTAALVFLQVLIGGLVVFGYLDTGLHIAVGYAVFGLAVLTLAGAVLSKPRYKPAVIVAAGLVLLVVLQGALGFAWLDSKDDEILAVHFANAMLIYGLSVAGVFIGLRWSEAEPTNRAP